MRLHWSQRKESRRDDAQCAKKSRAEKHSQQPETFKAQLLSNILDLFSLHTPWQKVKNKAEVMPQKQG